MRVSPIGLVFLMGVVFGICATSRTRDALVEPLK